MNGARFLVIAALVAGVGFGSTAQAQKSMYRCGNTYQDKPCDDEKGRVVGTTVPAKPAAGTATVCENNKCRTVETTGTPKPAASAKGNSESPEQAAERQRLDTFSKGIHAQHKARDCVKLRKVLSGKTSPREREQLQRDTRRLGCAWKGSEDLDAENKCADARGTAEMAEACGAYAKIGDR